MILIVDNRFAANNNKNKGNQNKDLVNENIRFPEVLLIGPNGEQLGVMSSREAQFKANDFDLDLLCVAPNAKPPVCKIINYSKYRFEQQKKAKEAKTFCSMSIANVCPGSVEAEIFEDGSTRPA